MKPERQGLPGPGDRFRREHWWRFAAFWVGLREAIAPLRRVLVRSIYNVAHCVVFVPKGWIFSNATIVFAFDDDDHFALLQSSVHELWSARNMTSLESTNRYGVSECFDTFPFPPREYQMRAAGPRWELEAMPEEFQRAARIGGDYHEHRRQIMRKRQLGLTKTYHLFHDRQCGDDDIRHLRALHIEMHYAILACYGWQDLDLRHDFYPNERGEMRFTIAPQARREPIGRLIDLNLQLARQETMENQKQRSNVRRARRVSARSMR